MGRNTGVGLVLSPGPSDPGVAHEGVNTVAAPVLHRYPANPYHNRIHAADVLRSLHVLVMRGGLVRKGYCNDIILFSCFLAAVRPCKHSVQCTATEASSTGREWGR